jgi:NAD(P)H dehydrogenase (quinone)
MHILLVHAHPEARSLNGALTRFIVGRLERQHHRVEVSDLYAMRWNAVLDRADRLDIDPEQRFDPSLDSREAYARGTQSPDIAREQDKLRRADAVILQFPLWWFSMPAILKGWVERVYAYGFAYGVGEHSDARWGDRYGEGSMAGKRAMLVVTAGGWESHYGPRGINGPIDDILFPIQHGILHYPGFDVLPPYVVYRTGKTDAARFERICAALGERLDTLFTTPPLPFRRQNGGDYTIPELGLRDDICPGRAGFGIHLAQR